MFGSEKHPKGPSLSRLVTYAKDLSGARVLYKTPVPSDDLNKRPELTPDHLNIFAPESYSDDNKRKHDRRLGIHSAAWDFTGFPLWTPELGDIQMVVDVVAIDLLPADETLFQRSVLAREVKRNIDETSATETHEGRREDPYDLTVYTWPNYLEPINWQWVTREGSEWLYYETQPLRDAFEAFTWITPLSRWHYLRLLFYTFRSTHNAGNPYRLAQRLPLRPYTDLMHVIMDTVNLTLAPSAAAERAACEARNAAQPLPFAAPTEAQIQQAKHILYMWSGAGYREKDKTDSRADPADVARFVDQRLVPVPLPGALIAPRTLSSG
jgi:hypothetical protein